MFRILRRGALISIGLLGLLLLQPANYSVAYADCCCCDCCCEEPDAPAEPPEGATCGKCSLLILWLGLDAWHELDPAENEPSQEAVKYLDHLRVGKNYLVWVSIDPDGEIRHLKSEPAPEGPGPGPKKFFKFCSPAGQDGPWCDQDPMWMGCIDDTMTTSPGTYTYRERLCDPACTWRRFKVVHEHLGPEESFRCDDFTGMEN